jgi:hypothetical protein
MPLLLGQLMANTRSEVIFCPWFLALKRSTLPPIALVRVLGIEKQKLEKQKERGVSYENG